MIANYHSFNILVENIKGQFQNKPVEIIIKPKNAKIDWRKYLRILNKNSNNINKAILKELYPSYKKTWAEGKPKSQKEFIDTLQVQTIEFTEFDTGEHEYILWYKPDGLFTDHAIFVNGSFKKDKFKINNIAF